MDYIYVGHFSIIDKIDFKDCILSNNHEYNYIVNEIIKHLDIYKNSYNIPNNLLLYKLNAIEIEQEFISCHKRDKMDDKYKLLVYIIFLTKTKFTIQEKEIETEKGSIIIFPSEWFFYFKLCKSKIIIGNVCQFKE